LTSAVRIQYKWSTGAQQEHLAAVPADMTVYIVGKAPEETRRYKCKLIKLAL